MKRSKKRKNKSQRSLNEDSNQSENEQSNESDHDHSHSGSGTRDSSSEESSESSSKEDVVDMENVEIKFEFLNEMEHLHNYRAISNILAAYEQEYMDCLKGLSDDDFTEYNIDECIGRNFLKVIIDLKYITMKTISAGDLKTREYFRLLCYNQVPRTVADIAGCSLLEKDVLGMLWIGLGFHEIIKINSDKYTREYAKLPLDIFEHFWGEFKHFSNAFFELIDEIDSHKDLTVLKIRSYIDDRIKLISEAFEENHSHVNSHQNQLPAETVDVVQSLELNDDQKRKLLPKFQLGKGMRDTHDENRFLNLRASKLPVSPIVEEQKIKKAFLKEFPTTMFPNAMNLHQFKNAANLGRNSFKNLHLNKRI